MAVSESLVAIVTGAASGIGLNITKLLLSKNYTVVMADVQDAQGEAQSQALGPRTSFVHCNVVDWDSNAQLFKETFQKFGRIDFFAANAGVADDPLALFGSPLDAASGPTKPNTKVIDINLLGVVYGVKLALFYMGRNTIQKGGKIVVTASATSFHALPGAPLYSATKHGCLALVRALAPVVASADISINAICPSMTESALTHGSMSLVPKDLVSTMDKVMEAYARFVDTDVSGTALEINAHGIFDRKPLDPELAQQWIDFGMAGFR